MSQIDLLVTLDRGRPSLRVQIEEQLRDAVRDGRLPSGTPLPSTRGLASELSVSRGVVVEAYAQLVAEGYLVAQQGGATRVADAAATAAAPDPARDAAAKAPRFDFRTGAPDVALFPRAAWLTSLRRAVQAAPDARFDYGDPRGAPELRAALASYLGRVRGVACAAGRVIVTSGMAQGMALFGRVLVERGERAIALEDPSSGPGRGQLASTGLDTVPVPVDDEGLQVERLAELGPSGPRVVMVTPAHQFPMGVVLSPGRRAALRDWLAATRRARARGRLRRRVPLRPPASGRPAGAGARARDLRRLRLEDACARPAPGLARGARGPHAGAGGGQGARRPRHAGGRAARPGGLPGAR